MKTTLEQLEARHEALIEALDRNHPETIAAASRELDEALVKLRSVQSWQADPELKLAAERIGRLADAAMMRVHVLLDQARRRGEALALVRGEGAALVYRR